MQTFHLPEAELVHQHAQAAALREGLAVPLPGAPRTARRSLGPFLRIAVLMPRTDVGGGSRVLLELSTRLQRRGHRVTLLSHFPAPTWFDVEADFVHVPAGTPLALAVPACDVVLAGYWALVREAAAQQIAPVVHVEQGDFHLFEVLPEDLEAQVAASLDSADAHTAVSSAVGRILADRYGVTAHVVPNAVDRSVFHPPARVLPSDRRRTVLAVGWDGNTFKGIGLVRGVAGRLRRSHPDVDVVWVTPRPPVDDPGDIARVIVAPTQTELAELYGAAAAYMCASDYESFALPCMEAMACGAPVVSTRNPGSLEYCRHGENSFLFPTGDEEAAHEALVAVLDDPQLAAQLREGGARTVDAYTWDTALDGAEALYRRVAEVGAPAGLDPAWVFEAGLVLDDTEGPASRERLEAVLARSGALRVSVPELRVEPDGSARYHWTVVAQRSSGRGDVFVDAVHVRVATGSPEDGHHLKAGLARAAAPGGERGGRGTAIAKAGRELVSQGRAREGLQLLTSAWAEHPDHPDLFALAADAAQAAGFVVAPERLRSVLAVLGNGHRYEEWGAPKR